MGSRLTWESVCACVAAGAFGYSCTTILGYDEVIFENESEGESGGSPTDTAHLLPACVPGVDKEPVPEECGVFVSAEHGDDDGAGSKTKPYRTLARALEDGAAVYACASAPFDEAVAIKGDARVFGGLDCEHGWAFVAGMKTVWTAPADEVPLRVAEGGRAELRDVLVAARDADRPGASSIAIVAAPGSRLDLLRCEVSAGDAQDGAPAANDAQDGAPGKAGQKGAMGCFGLDPATAPGLGAQHACGGVDVSGGSGGPGLAAGSGADGSDGSPAVAGSGAGDGGKKQDATPCTAGHAGETGADGTPGPGAGPESLGTFAAEGFAGADGGDGGAGKPGQGGGGGGGAKACESSKAGPSGGGGGAGGCGGAGGKGGRAGGASVGIVSLDATVTLAEVRIRTGRGGHGGDGAPGGAGGTGGKGGAAGLGDDKAKACAGGKGGEGGKGGGGGGGRGGHSIGIAHLGPAPAMAGVDIQAGLAGNGGDGDGPLGSGAAGVAAKTLPLD